MTQAMEIRRIAIHTADPLTGMATAEDERAVDFQGWLELLHALSTLVGTGGALSEEEQETLPPP